MPRFVTRPHVVVEANRWTGDPLPLPFQAALLGRRRDGVMQVATGDGPRPIQLGDWIMRGPNGEFSVWRGATFNEMFEPFEQHDPMPDSVPFKRGPGRPRKEHIHG